MFSNDLKLPTGWKRSDGLEGALGGEASSHEQAKLGSGMSGLYTETWIAASRIFQSADAAIIAESLLRPLRPEAFSHLELARNTEFQKSAHPG